MTNRTFGTRRMERPEGMLRPVHWAQLGRMDERTPDGRLLLGKGGGTRSLPRPFYAQFDNGGHYGAKLVGSLDEVTLHSNGDISGWGWVLDDENGQNLVRFNKAGAMRHNSLDLADVEVELKWGSEDPSDEGFWELEGIDFTKWNVGATTAVGMPAFPDAGFDIPEMTAALEPSDEPIELTATLIHVPLEEPTVTAHTHSYNPPSHSHTFSVTPSFAAATVSWDDFHIAESDEPHKIRIDREGRVFGHLAQWDVPHRGYDNVERYCPRPTQDYTEFNHPGPLTERGQVGTGPIVLCGGHPRRSMRGLSPAEIAEAYGGTENAWADVRVSAGEHGPWVSGRVRPGLSDAQLYAARASHISGHWIGDKLVGIVSVNVPGFLPGAGFSAQHADGLLELVAGFAPTEPRPVLQPVRAVTFADTTTTVEVTEETTYTVDVLVEVPDEDPDLGLVFAFDDE